MIPNPFPAGIVADLTTHPLAKDDWVATGTHWMVVVDAGTLRVNFSEGAERLTSDPNGALPTKRVELQRV